MIRVVFMDDYEPSRVVFGKLFREFRPTLVADTDDWREILARPFDVVFLNVRMGRCDGFEVAAYLREVVGYKGPIYAITGLHETQLTEDEVGVFDRVFTKAMEGNREEMMRILREIE